MTEHSKVRMNILQRLNRVMQAVTYVQKEKKQGMNYSIVSHDVVTAKVRPHLVEHGVVYFPVWQEVEQQGNRTQVKMAVRFASIDEPDDYIDVMSIGYGIDTQDKGPGKAISYAVKYALLKALGLETGDDPDNDQHVEYDNPANPHIIAVNKFLTDIEAADTLEQLAAAGKSHAEAMGKAADEFPAKVQSARAAYGAKLHQFKEQARHREPAE